MRALKFLVLFLFSMMLFGCASLDYTGEDYNVSNIETIKTPEDFVFKTYKKTLNNANIKIGISKTSIQEILALYVKVENYNYETPYIFKVEDLALSDSQGEIRFITSDNYLNIYQNQEAAAMGSMSLMGASITNMAGISTNYNEINQTMMQNSAQASNQDSYAKMEEFCKNILKHTVKVSSSISPRKAQYYYFFFENREAFPINVKYKTLNYQFNL